MAVCLRITTPHFRIIYKITYGRVRVRFGDSFIARPESRDDAEDCRTAGGHLHGGPRCVFAGRLGRCYFLRFI